MSYRIALRSRPDQHFAYSGRSVLVTGLDGQVRAGRHGLFVDNTRVISRAEFLADGGPLGSIAASPVGGDALLAYFAVPDSGGVPKDAVYLEIATFVGEGMRNRLRVHNYSGQTARFELAVALEADFADSEEVESGERRQSGEVETTWDEPRRELMLRYRLAGLDRAVSVTVDETPFPVTWAEGALRVRVEVTARGTAELGMTSEPIFDGRRAIGPARRSFEEALSPMERLHRQLQGELPLLRTTNSVVSQAWATATRDLASLPYGLAEGPATPIAGLPLYLQFFGRDSLTIGWQALLATPTLLRDSLRANAAWQGRVIDDWLDEEPGKMIHQARNGPLSAVGIDPLSRYYGDWATVPDFLIMLGQYLAWTNDRASIRRLLPAARAGLDWLDRYADVDRDGFIEYRTRSDKGVKNQGWKDSHDAIVDERGEIVANPIATSELQAYWYAALQQAGLVFAAFGDAGYGAELLLRARDLKRRFNEVFWMDDVGLYCMGLGPDGKQIRSIGSNDGHLLASGIVPAERGRAVAARLMKPDLFSGWGIRTLAASHPAYNPFSYHRGSVWPVEQGTIALGLARYGCWAELHRLAEAFFAASDLFVDGRLPEVIAGVQRDPDHPHPGIYPDSCEPQGWSASAVVMVVQALLGAVAVAPVGLLVVDPHLPDWLPDLRLEGVRVGDARLDLEFRRRADGRTDYRVTRRQGRVRVIRQPPPQGPRAGLGGRLVAAAGSVLRS